MKNFLIGWFVFQFACITLAAYGLDLNRTQEAGPSLIDCTSPSYFVESTIIDLGVPLINFTNLVERPCATSTQ